jgi:UDP-glucose 4-epimerase
MTRVLVTGPTGYCGPSIVRGLLAEGYTTRVLARRQPTCLPASIEIAIGDLEEIEYSLLDDVDFIVHLAALTASDAAADSEYDRVNHRATNALARAAGAAGVKRFVFVSSVSAQTGAAAEHPVSEKDEPHPQNAYGRSKLAAEHAVLASGVPFTILRPVMIYGDAPRGYLARMARLAALPFPLPFGSLRNQRSLLSLDNFVSAVLFVLHSEVAEGETYLVADPEPVALPDLLASFRKGLGRAPMVFPFPPAPLRWLVGGTGSELIVRPTKLMAAGWSPVGNTQTFLARPPGSRAK